MHIIRNSAMVTCFTENKNHLLIFAHYADSYKGVCIQYDLSLLDDNVYHGVSSYLFPVIYSDRGSKQPIKIYQTTLSYKKYKLDNKRLK